MKPAHLVSMAIGHALVAAALVGCAGSQQSSGVTNAQAPIERGGKCLGRGAQCLADSDCCSERCEIGDYSASSYCARE
jgi:hypothetical protein